MRAFLWIGTLLLLFVLAAAPLTSQAVGDNSFEALKRFSQVMDIVENHYVQDIPRSTLIEDAIKGMLEQLDPHSTYLNKDDFKDIQISTSGEFSGIGIEISLEQGRLTVISPIEDTPADKAGLKSGDIILEIDGQATQDITLTEAVKRIRGAKGSTVKLVILHKGSNKPVTVPIVRGTIPIHSVKTQELESGYLYVRLTRFNENTTRDMLDKLKEYKAKKEIKGLVLDLRNNPGGLLDQAVSVADAFLSDGLVVYIQGRDASQRKDFPATRGSEDVAAPMVTLINPGSASASEIVAGALQDHKRALLLGERSFGKGSVQTVIPLSDGTGIKLTTALYYTPNGRSIQAEGIVPDLEVPFVPTEEDKNADDRFTLREQDLSRHLQNNGGGKNKGSETSKEAGEMLGRDNQLRLALELVKKLPTIRQIR
ncbi:S41 family peptidase [Desulfovibrio aminophilus]|nr:S41 family peptidase [Desulfovibrio aminophilus]MCM0754326.1 S41 family peptidase [Desulfovibrio aminophilus]